MKNIYKFLRYFTLMLIVVVTINLPLSAQSNHPDFRNKTYREAIANIADHAQGRLNRTQIIHILENPKSAFPLPSGNFRSDTIYAVPEIAFAAWDQNTVIFEYFPEDTFWEDSVFVTFPQNPNWINAAAVIDSIASSINISIDNNNDITPRSTPVLIKGIFDSDTLEFTTFILQEGKPQQFILVSPKYQAISPQGGTTFPFTVTSFNVAEWTAIFSENWITVDSALLTDESISFNIEPNTANEPRSAAIEIQDLQNPAVKDNLAIFQFVDTSAYILASPSSGYFNSGAAVFDVAVNANINWEVEYTDVPEGMIADSTVLDDAVGFNITANTSQSQRMAVVSLKGVSFPEVTAQIEIFQSGEAPPYLFIFPKNSNAGPQAGSITLNVDANIGWEPEMVEDPAGMLTLDNFTPTTLTLDISENPLPSSRTARWRVKAAGSSLADTFRIVQGASFLLPDPSEKLIPCEGDVFMVNITRHHVDSVVTDTAGFFGTVEIFGNDSLEITIPANESGVSRADTIEICSFENPQICADIIVFQYACNQPYIIIAPKFHSLPYQGGTSGTYSISTSNVPGWEVYFENPVEWINDTLIDDNTLQFVLDQNALAQSREATFRIRSITGPEIFDTAVIFQDGAPAPVLLASPREQLVGFEGTDSLDFMVTYQNIEDWAIDTNGLPDWVHIDSAGGPLMSFDIPVNGTNSTRQSGISIYATNDTLIRDTVFVYQYAVNDAYILAAPRTDTVSYAGDTNRTFRITTVNVPGWEVDTLRLANWISVNEPHHPDSLSLTIEPNTSPLLSRFDTVWIQAVDHPDTNDFVVIYQYAAQESYLIAAPREVALPWPGNPATAFFVNAVHADSWEVAPGSVPEWINIIESGDLILLVDVAENSGLETRSATLIIFDPNQSGVTDSVTIYQYSKFDAYLMASPREKKFSQSGSEKTDFIITRVNVDSWEVNTANLPPWIDVINFGTDTLSLEISENPTSGIRQTTVGIFASGNPEITDSVSVFQYAASDTVLIASPREALVNFGGNTVEFNITTLNADSWKVDENTIASWIQINNQGGTLLALEVLQNDLPNARFNSIRIFDTLNPAVSDTIDIYQFAAPESYILASPREDTVNHTGGLSVFNISAVNLTSGWTVDEATLPFWIPEFSVLNDSTLQLNISPNTSVSTRSANLAIVETGNSTIRDSVSVFQYAAPEKYILAAPREQTISHGGGTLIFEVTAVNVENWSVDPASVPAWITDYEIVGENLILNLSENTTLITRDTTLRLFADSVNSMVGDHVSVFQYSGMDHYLLAAPREHKTGSLADTLYFTVDTVNMTSWQAEVPEEISHWVELLAAGTDTLGLAISQNYDSITRNGRIRLYNDAYPNAEDFVDVFQYSSFEPYIILDRTYETVSYQGDTIEILVYSNIDSIKIEKGNQSQWYDILDEDTISPGNTAYTVRLKIDKNPEAYLARSAYIKFTSLNLPDTAITGNFYFQQLINPNLNDIYFSGWVKQDTAGMENVNVIMGEDTVSTIPNGDFGKSLPYGWVGAVTPLKSGYFFEPPNYVFEIPQKNNNDTLNFSAFPIIPQIEFNIEGDTLFLCMGEGIGQNSPDYPVISVSGTFGQRSYKWLSDPFDPGINTDSTSSPAPQMFSPEVTTTYSLVMYNYGTSDTASFTVGIYPEPVAREIDGPKTVCKDQAGVIYSVAGFDPGEYFKWNLIRQDSLINRIDGNIAVIDWGSDAGEYELVLFTYNRYGCSDSIVETITMTDANAPPKAIVRKKDGDNMLISTNPNIDLFNYSWGWYTMEASGMLGEKYILPDKTDWFCRLPENHTFDPDIYKYFTSVTFKDGAGCESVSFLDDNAPVGFAETNSRPFKIFPNPTGGMIRIWFSDLTENQRIRCQIINISGQVVYSGSPERADPDKTIVIEETRHLQPGIYFFRAMTENQFYNAKFVVQ